MKVLYITYIEFKSTQFGASMRPQRMYRTFLEEGHEVKLLAVSQNRSCWNERRAAVAEISRWLDETPPDICYIESPVYPILMDCDYRLIRKIHRLGIPMGYYYRDCHRKFPELFPPRGGLVGSLKEAYLSYKQKRTDEILRLMDIVYFPTRCFYDLFDYADMRALPPGGVNRLGLSSPEKNTCIYVGGIVDTYGGSLLLDAFECLNRGEETYRLILVCREKEWNSVQHPCKDAPWLEVHHAFDNELEPLYKRAELAMAVYDGRAYANLTASIKLFEYLGWGLPFVVSGAAEMEDMAMRTGCGMRAARTPEAIAEAVRLVLRDREHYADAARAFFLGGNSWHDRVKQVVRELSEKKTGIEG